MKETRVYTLHAGELGRVMDHLLLETRRTFGSGSGVSSTYIRIAFSPFFNAGEVASFYQGSHPRFRKSPQHQNTTKLQHKKAFTCAPWCISTATITSSLYSQLPYPVGLSLVPRGVGTGAQHRYRALSRRSVSTAPGRKDVFPVSTPKMGLI